MAFEATPESVALRNAVLAMKARDADSTEDELIDAELEAATQIYLMASGKGSVDGRQAILATHRELHRLQGVAMLWLDTVCALDVVYKERYYQVNEPGQHEMRERNQAAMREYEAYAADLGIDAATAKEQVTVTHKHHCPVCGNGYF
jgi:hypothetical protein